MGRNGQDRKQEAVLTINQFCSPENTSSTSSKKIKWCTVGVAQSRKCDTWSTLSADDDGNARLECESGSTVQACLRKILVKR